MAAPNNRDFVVQSGLQLGGYITSVGGSTPTNGQLLIGDATNNRFSVGSLTATNGLTFTTGAGTIALTSNATSSNTASTIVSRDASGNFVAGTITAALTGNATSATKLQTARTINGVSFDGTANISFTTDAVAEGTTNLYFTTSRAANAAPVQTVFGRTGNVVLQSTDVSTALGYVPVNPNIIGAASGLATLDSSGAVPMSQMPSAVVGGLNYKGTWNASTNSPALASGTGTKGWMYKVATAGSTNIDGITQWNVGDIIAFNGTTWDKIDGVASEVTSVFGRTGDVVLQPADMITSWSTQTKNTVLAAPSAANGAVSFRALVAADMPLATTSLVGAVSVSTGLSVTGAGVLTANVVTVAGRTGNVVLAVADVSGAAPLASPVLTGNPTAPTPAAGDNDTSIATTAFVTTALTNAGVTPGGGAANFSGPLKVKLTTIDTGTASTASTSAAVIYSTAITAASTCKFVVQVVDASNNLQSAELLVITDATNIWMTTYAMLVSNASLGTYSAQLSGGNLQLLFTPASSTAMTVKVRADLLVQ
jgi:hypothetical protein